MDVKESEIESRRPQQGGIQDGVVTIAFSFLPYQIFHKVITMLLSHHTPSLFFLHYRRSLYT